MKKWYDIHETNNVIKKEKSIKKKTHFEIKNKEKNKIISRLEDKVKVIS